MKYVKKFENFVKEATSAASHQPTTTPSPNPTIAPPSTRPEKPSRPGKPIERPSVDPDPKAHADKVTELDVAKRFISELDNIGEPIEKYLDK